MAEDGHGVTSYLIEEPILNHDYEIIEGVLAKLEFTPKDMKPFNMRKEAEAFLDSPIFKHFRKDTSLLEGEGRESQELDLATWMSVGGSREWGQQRKEKSAKGVKERLQGLHGM